MCSRQIGGFPEPERAIRGGGGGSRRPEGVAPFSSVRKTGCSVPFGRLGVRFGSED